MKTRRKRFEDIAAKRVQKVLDGMDSLAKCSNKANYEYTSGDVKKMMNVIKEKVRTLEFAFNQQANHPDSNTFKF